MKIINLKQKILYAIISLVVGNLLIWAVFSGISSYRKNIMPPEITISEAKARIRQSQVKSVLIRPNEAIFNGSNMNRFYTSFASESERESVIFEICEHNKFNNKNTIVSSLEPEEINLVWLIILNFLPLTMFGFSFIFIVSAFLFFRNNKYEIK